MAEPSAGTILRQLQVVQGGMKKARKAMLLVREDPTNDNLRRRVLEEGWASLVKGHQTLAGIPLASATEDVMTRQLALQRYATSLLVRLRRLARNDAKALDGLDEEGDDLD